VNLDASLLKFYEEFHRVIHLVSRMAASINFDFAFGYKLSAYRHGNGHVLRISPCSSPLLESRMRGAQDTFYVPITSFTYYLYSQCVSPQGVLVPLGNWVSISPRISSVLYFCPLCSIVFFSKTPKSISCFNTSTSMGSHLAICATYIHSAYGKSIPQQLAAPRDVILP